MPATGVYHFDAQVTYYEATPGSFRLFLDNNTNLVDGEYARSYYAVTASNETITLKLTAGSSVLVHTWHNTPADMTINWVYFQGTRYIDLIALSNILGQDIL